MKKKVCAMLSAALLLSLAACGQPPAETLPTGTEPQPSEDPAAVWEGMAGSDTAILEKLKQAAAGSSFTYNGKAPVIDSCVTFEQPIPYRKVTGHFEGTKDRFAFYFPATFEGRFFQRLYPLEDENASEEIISFGAENGGYTVKSNSGSSYQLDAAAAALSRTIAAAYYQMDAQTHIFGYAYGGSGGSYQVIGAAENTTGVWDGFVPYITGLPTAIPNYFFTRAYARFFLEDKADAIEKEMNPGGSGDPYSVLETDLEKQIFKEVTDLGIPLRAWEDAEYVLRLDQGPEYLLGFAGTASAIDSSYVTDFWTKEGYLGTENSALGEAFRQARIVHDATILSVEYSGGRPTRLLLDYVPENLSKCTYQFVLLDKDGNECGELSGTLNGETGEFVLSGNNSGSLLLALKEGAQIRMDNSYFLAYLAYARYQVPKDPSYYAWDQYRDADGSPLYPQRINLGGIIADSQSGGALYDGHFDGKMIMVGNLLDCDAYVWDCDWYSKNVQSFYGDAYEGKFRLWYNDHADHIEFGPRSERLVQYDGIVERALIDLSDWVEKGIEPAQSTAYTLVGSQIEVPENANERHGVQPVVDLEVAQAKLITIHAGDTVDFCGLAQVPDGQGSVIQVEWDFLGNGSFETAEFGAPSPEISVTASYQYLNPGTYYAALRVTSEKNGNTNTTHANVENLDRVCIVVLP